LRGWPVRRQGGAKALKFVELDEDLCSGLESLKVAALDGAVDALQREAEHVGRFRAGEDKPRAIRVSPLEPLGAGKGLAGAKVLRKSRLGPVPRSVGFDLLRGRAASDARAAEGVKRRGTVINKISLGQEPRAPRDLANQSPPPWPARFGHRFEALGEALEGGDRLGGLGRLVGRADLERGAGQLTRSSSSSRRHAMANLLMASILGLSMRRRFSSSV